MQVTSIYTSLFKQNDDLTQFIIKHVATLQDRSVLIITSKIVALAQGRTASLTDKEAIIKSESREIISTPYGTLTLTSAGWCINAGVDESNAYNELVLLPQHTLQVATQIRSMLVNHFKIDNLGIVITDTRTVPLRKATIGRAIATAGLIRLKVILAQPIYTAALAGRHKVILQMR